MPMANNAMTDEQRQLYESGQRFVAGVALRYGKVTGIVAWLRFEPVDMPGARWAVRKDWRIVGAGVAPQPSGE